MAGARLTQAELATALGVQRGTVSKWKAKGLPIGADGKITMDEAQEWRRGRRSGKRDGDALMPGEHELAQSAEGVAAMTQFRKARAAREMLVVKELRGELVPLTEIDGLLVQRALEFRNALAAIESRVPARFPEVAAKLKKVLHDEFRALLERYSRPDPLLEGGKRKKAHKRRR